MAVHFREFLFCGYRVSAEAIITKFEQSSGDRVMHDFTVGLVDGQSKLLLMLSIVAFVDELEISEDAINQCPMLLKTLESFRYIRCAYQHFENAAGHYLNSLRHLQWV